MQGLSEYQGQLIFVLEPGEKVSSDEENEKLYLRPNFSFDPSLGILSLYWMIKIWKYCSSTVIREISLKKSDSLLPCSEAGLPFQPGAILEVIQRKEEWWWQARQIATQSRTDDVKPTAGLIPSVALGLLHCKVQ